jgi:hypothetical protein
MGTRRQNRSCWGLEGWYHWEGEAYKERCRSMGMVEKLCTHICKWKMRSILEGGVDIKENGGGDEFNYNIL